MSLCVIPPRLIHGPNKDAILSASSDREPGSRTGLSRKQSGVR